MLVSGRVTVEMKLQHTTSGCNHQDSITIFPVQLDQTLPIGSRELESFTWIILNAILCLVLDFQVFFGETVKSQATNGTHECHHDGISLLFGLNFCIIFEHPRGETTMMFAKVPVI